MGGPQRQAPLSLTTLIVLTLGLGALAASAAVLPVRFPFNTNEGWNALHALDAMRSANPYRADGFANFANYPPGWFYLTGWLGGLFGDHVVVGRVIALLSQLAIALNIGLLARRAGANRDGSALAAGLFLLVTALIAPMHMVVNDPQWLGHALQTTALVLLLRRDTIRPATLLGALALLVLGGLMKHNLVALPAAITLWLLLHHRGQLLLWLGAAFALVAALALLAYGLYGDAIFVQILGHRRGLEAGNLWTNLTGLVALAPFALIGALTARHEPGGTPARFLALYGAIALVTGALFAAGTGVQANTWFDLAIATSPLVGLAVADTGFGQRGWFRAPPLPQLLLAATAAAAIVWLLPGALVYYRLRLDAPRFAAELAPAIAALAAAPGPVACEDPTLCYWAGRDNAVDFFNGGQAMLLDPATDAAFRAAIGDHAFAMIQTFDAESGRLPADANATIVANYRADTAAPVHLYVPMSR